MFKNFCLKTFVWKTFVEKKVWRYCHCESIIEKKKTKKFQKERPKYWKRNRTFQKKKKIRKKQHIFQYSQTCVQRPPLGHEKSGRCSEVVVVRRFQKTEIPILLEFCVSNINIDHCSCIEALQTNNVKHYHSILTKTITVNFIL